MNRKKVLFLGGAYSQIPIIREAKSRGWYIIVCDYLPNNPGQKLADEFYNVSTTDFEGVLALAKKTAPDFVIAYASDPAAPTAAWVSEQMGLPGNPYKSVQLLSEKDLFRSFLLQNGFNTPQAISIKSIDDIEKLKALEFPIIIKPTDSSGSKGVSRVDFWGQLEDAANYAFAFARNNRIIAEEFIDNDLGDIHGDGFVIDGHLAFCHLGDHIYNAKSNIFNPCGTQWPSQVDNQTIHLIEKELERLVKLSGFKMGSINIEARINNLEKAYIMEVGPRSGGHFVPQAIQYATGFDMVKAILDNLSGDPVAIPKNKNLCSAYHAIHSDIAGTLKQLEVENEIKPFIKEFHQYIKPGEQVKSFQGANAAIGILLLSFQSRDEMSQIMSNISKHINLIVE